MTIKIDDLADALRPIAPPRVLEDVYTEDQYSRILTLLKENGPWPTITTHHFNTVEELVATTSGPMRDGEGPKLTLDDIATAHFRGYFGKGSTCFYPEIEDCFYSEKFLALARDYWGASFAKPTHMLFNFCGAHHSGLSPHIDAVQFRGIRIENSPVWLANIMGKSGLFFDHMVKMAQVIAWWYRGEHGTFTYWPDGPFGQPKVLEHPLWDKGVLVQNEVMFHRGDPVGRPEDRDISGLKHRSLIGYDPERNDWAITTDGNVIRRYQPEETRLLVHWSAEVFSDKEELEKSLDGSDDLTTDIAFDRLIADMRERGVKVAEPSDPMNDSDFIRTLIETYTIAPTTDWLMNPSA